MRESQVCKVQDEALEWPPTQPTHVGIHCSKEKGELHQILALSLRRIEWLCKATSRICPQPNMRLKRRGAVVACLTRNLGSTDTFFKLTTLHFLFGSIFKIDGLF